MRANSVGQGPQKRWQPPPDFRLWVLKARDAGFGNLVVVDRVRKLVKVVSGDLVLPITAERTWAQYGTVPHLEGVVFWLPSVLKQIAVSHLTSETEEEFALRARLAPRPVAEWTAFENWLRARTTGGGPPIGE